MLSSSLPRCSPFVAPVLITVFVGCGAMHTHMCVCWLWCGAYTYVCLLVVCVFVGCGIHICVFVGCGIHICVFVGCGIHICVFVGCGALHTVAIEWGVQRRRYAGGLRGAVPDDRGEAEGGRELDGAAEVRLRRGPPAAVAAHRPPRVVGLFVSVVDMVWNSVVWCGVYGVE